MKFLPLIFSPEAGGAEVLTPVIRTFQQFANINPLILSYGFGAKVFEKHGFTFTKMEPTDNISEIVRDINPSFIITSACSAPHDDMNERRFWEEAEKRNIPSMAFLDEWQGYEQRFSGVRESEYLAYIPRYINCINETGKNELISLGISTDRLIMFGQPYLHEQKKNLIQLESQRRLLRMKIGLFNKETILFISQPIKELYDYSKGYTQYEILEKLLSKMSEIKDERILVIKLHPRENKKIYQELLEKYKRIRSLLITTELSPEECIIIADLVVGMTSVMMTQAYILNRPCISFQPNTKKLDWMLSKEKFITTFTEWKDVQLPLQYSSILNKDLSIDFDQEAFLLWLNKKVEMEETI